MSNTEKLCLKWNDFQENITAAFASLREDQEFTDVTLVCKDGQQVAAHKAILVSSSPFFQDVLKIYKHPHPIIFMMGLKYEDLVAIVDFIYNGEANVYQENLDSFLSLAEELKLKGLMPEWKTDQNIDKPEKPEQQSSKSILQNTNLKNLNEVSENSAAYVNQKTDTIIAISEENMDLNEQINSMMNFSEVRHGSQGRGRICKVCGKEGQRINIMDHIETHHISGISLNCNFCGKTFRSRVSIRLHKLRMHKVWYQFSGQGVG